ncbi:MAG: DUF3791 domain-containing protein [Bacteroidetes bacterium]|nr:DUF3791 domain-containing protein [Bacteroidota bacterium]
MIRLSSIQQFQLFCLESYRAEKKTSGKQALQDFEYYDVFHFLENGYEVLHTQGERYIVHEINHYLESRK